LVAASQIDTSELVRKEGRENPTGLRYIRPESVISHKVVARPDKYQIPLP
jgi:hypothetical protein